MQTVVTGVDPELTRYARGVAGRLGDVLAGGLEAAYLVGSVAAGDFVPERSDVDVMAVCGRSLDEGAKRAVARALVPQALACPARGLELVVYSLPAVLTPQRKPRFEVNLNAGPAMPRHVSFDPATEPSHWFLLDLAAAREHAVPLVGPPAREVLGPIPRSWALGALEDSLTWHVENEPLGENSVLNACRAWRFAEEDLWSSKGDAAAWARPRAQDPSVIDAALAVRRGKGRGLDPDEIEAFLRRVRALVRRELRSL